MNVIKVKSVVLDDETAKEESRMSTGGAVVTLVDGTIVKLNKGHYQDNKPQVGWFYILSTTGANTFSKTDPTAKPKKVKATAKPKAKAKPKKVVAKKPKAKKVVAKKKAPKKKK